MSGHPFDYLRQKLWHHFCNVVGVRYENEDGVPRQTYVRDVKVRDGLILERERDNPHDPNAVMLLTHLEKQVGYLPREVAAFVSEHHELGWKFDCVVMKRDRRRDDDVSPPFYLLDILLFGGAPEVLELEQNVYLTMFVREEIQRRYPRFPIRSLIPS